MENKFLKISNKNFYIDVDSIMKWCFSSSMPPIKETEINEGYDTNDDGDLMMVTKVFRESKSENTQEDNIKYDFVKVFLLPFLTELNSFQDIENNFFNTLMFNTLLKMGFLVEIID